MQNLSLRWKKKVKDKIDMNLIHQYLSKPAHISVLCLVCGLLISFPVMSDGFWSGRQLMEEVYRRHEQYPYVYEEHTMVMVDRMGNRDTRQARRYTRVEENDEVKLLYIFDSPPEVKGVTLMAIRSPEGKASGKIYLPAYGDTFIESTGAGSDGNFLGTDFSAEDLTAENLDLYDYVRLDNKTIHEVDYFVVDVYPSGNGPEDQHSLRRHFIRQDCFYITRTDYFDSQGRLSKQMSQYDLRQLDDEMWRAGIILMVDKKLHHQSIIKINRRIFSEDYVPEEIFSEKWVLANNPPLPTPETDFDNDEVAGPEETSEDRRMMVSGAGNTGDQSP